MHQNATRNPQMIRNRRLNFKLMPFNTTQTSYITCWFHLHFKTDPEPGPSLLISTVLTSFNTQRGHILRTLAPRDFYYVSVMREFYMSLARLTRCSDVIEAERLLWKTQASFNIFQYLQSGARGELSVVYI